MKDFPPELIYILIFGAVLLFNFVMQKAARQRQQEAAQNEPMEEEIPEEVWRGTQPAPVQLPALAQYDALRRRAEVSTVPPAVSPARSRLRVARQSLFGARWDMQEAVVVATILGRCRADEQHDVR